MSSLEVLRNLLWGWHTLFIILAAGIYFSVKSGFFQIRKAGLWLKKALSLGHSEKRSSFQALCAAMAGSIGTGNIVGVAAAISAGGPGALFWMWLSALFGMMTVFCENALSFKHKEAPGALGYIRSVKKAGPALAAVYAAGCALSYLGMGNMAQTNACAAAMRAFGVPEAFSGVILAAVAFFVGMGGLKLAVKITEKLVPFMTLLFFAASVMVLWTFKESIPHAVISIFEGAFSLKAGIGGTAGFLIAMREGVSRGVFTNEAGLGSSTFAYSGLEDEDSVSVGCMGIFQVFLDTIVMCTVTGLCILCCRSPVLSGAELTFYAYSSALGIWGERAVSACTALFAFGTLVSWCCYGREGLFYLTHGRGRRLYAVISAAAAFLGCMLPLENVLQFGDAMNGLMALPNVIALFALRKELFFNEHRKRFN